MLHHRAEHNLGDASAEPVGAARQCQERDVPSTDLHHPGGNGGYREGEEHEATGPVHPQALLRKRNLPPQTPQPAQTY